MVPGTIETLYPASQVDKSVCEERLTVFREGRITNRIRIRKHTCPAALVVSKDAHCKAGTLAQEGEDLSRRPERQEHQGGLHRDGQEGSVHEFLQLTSFEAGL